MHSGLAQGGERIQNFNKSYFETYFMESDTTGSGAPTSQDINLKIKNVVYGILNI